MLLALLRQGGAARHLHHHVRCSVAGPNPDPYPGPNPNPNPNPNSNPNPNPNPNAGKAEKLEVALEGVSGPSRCPGSVPRVAWVIGHGSASPAVVGASNSCHLAAGKFVEVCTSRLAPLYGIVLCTCHAAALAKHLRMHPSVAVRAPCCRLLLPLPTRCRRAASTVPAPPTVRCSESVTAT